MVNAKYICNILKNQNKQMKKVFLNTLFLMLSIISLAQTSDISISVSDAETDGPLLGATVYF